MWSDLIAIRTVSTHHNGSLYWYYAGSEACNGFTVYIVKVVKYSEV